MWLLLLACTPAPSPKDPFEGWAELTVAGGPTGPELVELAYVGWSQVSGEPYTVLTAADQDLVFELMVVLDQAPVLGANPVAQLRYRKGLQGFLDHEASCTLTLSDQSTVGSEAPYDASLDCAGLVPEDAQEGEPWSIVGELTGGAWTQPASRQQALAGPFYETWPSLHDSAGLVVGLEDTDRLLLVPWRQGEVKLVWEDGADDSRDDVVLSVVPDTSSITLRRWTRVEADPLASLWLTLRSEQDFTAALEGSGEEQTGRELELQLWSSVQEGQDEARVLLR